MVESDIVCLEISKSTTGNVDSMFKKAYPSSADVLFHGLNSLEQTNSVRAPAPERAFVFVETPSCCHHTPEPKRPFRKLCLDSFMETVQRHPGTAFFRGWIVIPCFGRVLLMRRTERSGMFRSAVMSLGDRAFLPPWSRVLTTNKCDNKLQSYPFHDLCWSVANQGDTRTWYLDFHPQ